MGWTQVVRRDRSLDTGRGRRCLSIRKIMGKTTINISNFRLREALPGWHSKWVQQENFIAQLNWRGGRGEKKNRRQQLVVKRYTLTHLFWEVLFAWTSASYSFSIFNCIPLLNILTCACLRLLKFVRWWNEKNILTTLTVSFWWKFSPFLKIWRKKSTFLDFYQQALHEKLH